MNKENTYKLQMLNKEKKMFEEYKRSQEEKELFKIQLIQSQKNNQKVWEILRLKEELEYNVWKLIHCNDYSIKQKCVDIIENLDELIKSKK